jgi:predicted GIY-YIG superfamily endonuclease
MTITVYALRFENGEIYIGMTADLSHRCVEHKRRPSSPAKRYKGEFTVAYYKTFPTYFAARQHEKFLQSGAGRAFLAAMIEPPKRGPAIVTEGSPRAE